jgi:hypothetical protein
MTEFSTIAVISYSPGYDKDKNMTGKDLSHVYMYMSIYTDLYPFFFTYI